MYIYIYIYIYIYTYCLPEVSRDVAARLEELERQQEPRKQNTLNNDNNGTWHSTNVNV